MTKLTVICGPTAVGKTDFALSIAQKMDADLISVDSRQVYVGMNIGTGKDIPAGSTFTKVSSITVGSEQYVVGYYTIQKTRLWLCDIATPNQPFSSGVYKRALDEAIACITQDKRSVILIGGTGYYVKSIINPPDTMVVPPNQALRNTLEQLPLKELQARLHHYDGQRLESMNPSDYANPRRLIRAIEVALSPHDQTTKQAGYQANILGLTAPKEYRVDRITKRVTNRIDKGFSAEVTLLQQQYPNFLNLPAGNTLGYQEWGKYLAGVWSKEEAITHWVNAEISYSSRQLTWFNKQTDIAWFDITQKTWYAQASEQLERWMKYGTHHA